MPNKNLEERTKDVRSIYRGKILELLVMTVELPNGKDAKREVVRHPGAVAILAVTNDQKVLCVEQYRTAPNEVLLEVPAGKLEPGESPDACAVRELAEETGYRAAEMRHVATFYTSPGFADEQIHLFSARHLTAGQQQPDEDEFVALKALTRDEVAELVSTGRVRDAKTLIAFLWWLQQSGDAS